MSRPRIFSDEERRRRAVAASADYRLHFYQNASPEENRHTLFAAGDEPLPLREGDDRTRTNLGNGGTWKRPHRYS